MEYPGIIVGDFDSITEETKKFFTSSGRLRHEPDQDSTDLSKTLKVLMETVKIKLNNLIKNLFSFTIRKLKLGEFFYLVVSMVVSIMFSQH